MKHLLNICNINGAEVEPVDIITFGSPCQDMSVAESVRACNTQNKATRKRHEAVYFLKQSELLKK
jgi:DNA (cytosine-5)-methyltransferase 1